MTTVGLLAGAITPAGGLDTSRHAERAAVVDALQVLIAWGALRATAGDVDAFVDSDSGNAILAADTARLHRLLTSVAAPSTLPDGLDTEHATEALSAEPRYGDAPHETSGADDEQRLRWLRHTLARRLLDDPVTHLADLTPAEVDYLTNPAGRRWIRERIAEAGFELEERAEGLLAVDPDGLATDRLFPAPQGNAHQFALLLVDRLLTGGAEASGGRVPSSLLTGGVEGSGRRVPSSVSAAGLRREVDAVLERFPAWARGSRDGDGPDRLAGEAVDLLVSFGLARREVDGTVTARPALARYRAGEPVTTGGPSSLFEEAP